MIQIRRHLYRSVFLIWFLLLFCSGRALAEPASADERLLLAKHQALAGKLEKNQFNAPIYLESTELQGSLRVDMYGTFNYSFEAVKDALVSPADWCDITSLHINIKACTYRKGEPPVLTLYSGRKYYQPPADAYPLKLKFKIISQQPQYLDIALTADQGPLRTKDHRIRLQAVPVDGKKTFLHFSYTYSTGAVARMAIKSYFSTIGRDKVGFSIVKRGGKAAYIDGVRGAIERNTVRYYLAMETYMDALKYPESQRFEQRLNRWYDLTTKYRQLKENEKSEYLADKRKERTNQVTLQNKEGK